MSVGENEIAKMRGFLDREKTRVPRCWFALEQCQREAICYTAKLPMSLARREFPIGKRDREKLREAVIGLDYQRKFPGGMGEESWSDARALKSEEMESAERLTKSKDLLATLVNNPQTANSGQKKTPVNSAANA